MIKRSVRKNYLSMADGAVHSCNMRPPIVSKVCTYVESEMRAMGSISHDSFFRDSDECLSDFSWEAVYDELLQHMPTLMTILSKLIPKSAERKPLQCVIASQLLKCRYPKMGLVQRAISVMLYGNSVAKQVTMNSLFCSVFSIWYRCLQTFSH